MARSSSSASLRTARSCPAASLAYRWSMGRRVADGADRDAAFRTRAHRASVQADRREIRMAAVGSGDHEDMDVVGTGIAAIPGPADGLLVGGPAARGQVGCQRVGTGEVKGHARMVKQVPSDTGQVRDGHDAQGAQTRRPGRRRSAAAADRGSGTPRQPGRRGLPGLSECCRRAEITSTPVTVLLLNSSLLTFVLPAMRRCGFARTGSRKANAAFQRTPSAMFAGIGPIPGPASRSSRSSANGSPAASPARTNAACGDVSSSMV